MFRAKQKEREAKLQQEVQNQFQDEDLASLNQRLKCTTDPKTVEQILGTPEGALGPQSIRSLIPSRKSRTAGTIISGVTRMSSSIMTQSVLERPFYNPESKDVEPMATADVYTPPPRRQKALYHGRYFPCFGLFCAPLAGTEIFPFSPKMEKLHFAVATDQPVDHLDGEPQSQYLDDIKNYMTPVLIANAKIIQDRFLYRYANDFEGDWQLKFPFASHRFGQMPYVAKEIGDEERFTTFESRPDQFYQYVDHKSRQNTETCGFGSKLRHESEKITESSQAKESTQRQLATTVSDIKNRHQLSTQDTYSVRFQKFLEFSKRFFESGHKRVQNVEQLSLVPLQTFHSYEQFENWVFQTKDQVNTPNIIHEKILYQEPWNTQFTETQKIKIAGWISNLFRFERMRLISGKVSSILFGLRLNHSILI